MSNLAFASNKIYIDENELDRRDCYYHIHTGGNIWIETKMIMMNPTGLYTYDRHIVKEGNISEYERKWKCPYCHQYWKVGQSCQNKDCPSKYK